MLNTYTGFLKSTKENASSSTDVIKKFIKDKSYRLVPFSKDLILIFSPSEESFILFGNRKQGGNIDFNTIPPFTEIEISDVTKAEIETIDTSYSLLKLTVTAKIYYKIDKYYKNEDTVKEFPDISNIVFYMLPLNVSLNAVQINKTVLGDDIVSASPLKTTISDKVATALGSATRATGAFMGVAYTKEQKAKIDEIIGAITFDLNAIVTPIKNILNKTETTNEQLQILNDIMYGKIENKDTVATLLKDIRTETDKVFLKVSSYDETTANFKDLLNKDSPTPAPGSIEAALATARGSDNMKRHILYNFDKWKKESLKQDLTSLVTNSQYKESMTILKQFYIIYKQSEKANQAITDLTLLKTLYEGISKSLPDPEVTLKTIMRGTVEGIAGIGRGIGQSIGQSVMKGVKGIGTGYNLVTRVKPIAKPPSGGGTYVMYKKKEYKARENTKGTYIVVDGKRKYVTLN